MVRARETKPGLPMVWVHNEFPESLPPPEEAAGVRHTLGEAVGESERTMMLGVYVHRDDLKSLRTWYLKQRRAIEAEWVSDALAALKATAGSKSAADRGASEVESRGPRRGPSAWKTRREQGLPERVPAADSA